MAKRKKAEIDLVAEFEKSYRKTTHINKLSPIDDLFIEKPEAALKIWASLAPKKVEAQIEHKLNFVQIASKSPMPAMLQEEIIDISIEAH